MKNKVNEIIIGINLILLIIYSVICIFMLNNDGLQLLVCIVWHIILALLLGVLYALKGDRQKAKTFALSCGLVVLLGSATMICFFKFLI